MAFLCLCATLCLCKTSLTIPIFKLRCRVDLGDMSTTAPCRLIANLPGPCNSGRKSASGLDAHVMGRLGCRLDPVLPAEKRLHVQASRSGPGRTLTINLLPSRQLKERQRGVDFPKNR